MSYNTEPKKRFHKTPGWSVLPVLAARSAGLLLAFGALAVPAAQAQTAPPLQTVTLTAGDDGGARPATYGHMAGESGAPSPNRSVHHADTIPKARLKSLTVTPVTGSLVWYKPAFRKGHRGPYTVWVTHDATEVTLDAVATWEHARVEMPEDVDGETEGTQVEVPADARKVYTIKVFTGPKDKPCREDLDLCRFYSLVVRRPGSAVTGEREKLPSMTDGDSLRYRFRVKLSAPVELPLSQWESDVFTLTNGTITAAKRVGGVGSGPNGDPVAKTWDLKVNPTGTRTVVAYTSKSSCTVTGAVCTVGGLKLASLDTLTFRRATDGVPEVSIADASAHLEDGEIEFTVSMTKAWNRYAYVDFRTIDSGDGMGTATPGEDYRPQTTRLVIPPGKKKASAGVALIAESEANTDKTIKVLIENARLVNGNQTLYKLPISRSKATGTIDCRATRRTHCSIEVGESVIGILSSVSERDWFRVEFDAAQGYLIEMPESSHDSEVQIARPNFFGVYRDDGTLIGGTEGYTNASADDDGSTLNFIARRSGIHYLSAGSSSGTGRFKLTVTEVELDAACLPTTATTCSVTVGSLASGEIDFTGDRDWYEVDFVSGTDYRIALKGFDSGGGLTLFTPQFHGIFDNSGTSISGTASLVNGNFGGTRQVTYTATRTGVHYLSAGGFETADHNNSSTGTYKLEVTVDDCRATTATQCSVTVGGSASGEIEAAGDRDWYEVQFVSGTAYQIDLKGTENDGALSLSDPKFFGIFDNDGTAIGGTTNDNGIGNTTGSRVVYRATRSGAHYLAAGGVDDDETGTYELEVTELDDDCTADTSTTCSVTVDGSASGELELFGDLDWYEVDFVSGTEYRIDLKGTRNDSSLTLPDPYFYGIYDNDGTAISGTTNDDGIGSTTGSRVEYTATRTGAHYLSAGGYEEGEPEEALGTYELEVTDISTGYIPPPLDGVTPDAAAAALLGEGELTQAQLGALDGLGNANGSYDLGDVLSWIERCRRGEWDCGTSPSSAAAALPAARKGRGTSRRTRRDPGSRTAGRARPGRRRTRENGARSRSSRAARSPALALLLAAAVAASCTDEAVQPPLERDRVHQAVPGYLTVQLTVPSSAPAIGAVLAVEGPAIDSLRAPGFELIREAEPSTTRRMVIVAGSLSTGPLLEFHVPDRAAHAQYRVKLLQLSGEDYALRDPAEYRVSIVVN